MPTITINGVSCTFTPGQMILQVANAHGIEIPQYCYHDGLSIVASCRICLGECWAPNPKTGKVEPYMGGKLLPTCQTAAVDGMVVYTDSPKAVQNQKAVMEYLLINHPLDCPVCDQAGECLLQDYSYQYGRGVSRFEEVKVKQPKKDVGPHVLLYSDRCIMCSRCVRFTREVTGTAELSVQGRGNKAEIDVFPGKALDNELSANVIDLCPVGALLDKDFLFAQRVWFLKSTPSVDPLTASGDNIFIEHNEGRIYRVKPRTNLAVNKWWITDEVRYGWKFVHSEDRLRTPMRRQFGALVESDPARALAAAAEGVRGAIAGGRRLALVVSPMLTCEDAFLLARSALALDPKAVLAVGPVPTRGQDKHFPPTGPADKQFKVWAEKAPNARGVRRVLEAVAGAKPLEYAALAAELRGGRIGAIILTGNYPAAWADDALLAAVSRANSSRPFTVQIDTLSSRLVDEADVVLPSATWAEKAGTFQSGRDMLQSFEAAIAPPEHAAAEGQIALDLLRAAAAREGGSATETPAVFYAAATRRQMAELPPLKDFATLAPPATTATAAPAMEMVEL
ncbi:MAG: (2Fe-2S)-binding protein [Phycisphaerae bacterium]|nr:(2Fe-2S)-binding protein [Phycisphaerae bacterium]